MFILVITSMISPALLQSFAFERPTELSPKQMREWEKEQDVEIMAAMWCNRRDKFAPCACKEILTNTEVHDEKTHRIIKVEFPEYTCDIKENNDRRSKGMIANGYACEQLRTRRILYRDVNDDPIKVQVSYEAGCELRCINQDCRIAYANFTTNLNQSSESNESEGSVRSASHRIIKTIQRSEARRNSPFRGVNNTQILPYQSKPSELRMKIKNLCSTFKALRLGESRLCKSVIQYR